MKATEDIQNTLDKKKSGIDSLSLKMFREQFPNISMEGKGWYKDYLSNVELKNTLQGKNPNALTDWYSPTLDCFFDYRTDFTYFKHETLRTHLRQVKECSIGRNAYMLWFEPVKSGRYYTSEYQWYVIDLTAMNKDMDNDDDWIYYVNNPTDDYGGWNTPWMHIGDDADGVHHINRLKNRHSYTFEEVFHIPKK